LYDLFTNKDYLDTPADHVKLLLGTKDEKRPSEVATKEHILAALDWAIEKAGANDLVLFAFIGEGAPVGDPTCFFATDSTVKERVKNALLTAELEQHLTKLKSQRFCGLIDVNFKGFDNTQKEKLVEPNALDLYKAFIGNDNKEDQPATPGRVLFLAND